MASRKRAISDVNIIPVCKGLRTHSQHKNNPVSILHHQLLGKRLLRQLLFEYHDVSIDHRVLDEIINTTLGLFRSHGAEPNWPFVLSTIANDERLVSLTISGAKEQLERQPSINVVLQKAWEESSFKEVRQLGMFYVRYTSSFDSLTHQPRNPLAAVEARVHVGGSPPFFLGLVTTTGL